MVSYISLPSKVIESKFPRLNSAKNYEFRSPLDYDYNCIAFAAGDTQRWWWPVPFNGGHYWPLGVPREPTVSAFVAAFESIGYELCSSGEPDDRYDIIVLYARENKPTHAARYEHSTDMWLSKLGIWLDIAHNRAEDIGGDIYGEPVQYMRRAIV